MVAAGLSSRGDHPPLLFLGIFNNHGGHPVCWVLQPRHADLCSWALHLHMMDVCLSRALITSCCFWLDGPALSTTGRDGDVLVNGWIYGGIVGNMLYCHCVNSMFNVGILSTRVQSCPLGYFGQMTSPSQTPASSQSTIIAFQAVVWISLKCLPSSQDSTMLVLFFFRMLQVVHFFFFSFYLKKCFC